MGQRASIKPRPQAMETRTERIVKDGDYSPRRTARIVGMAWLLTIVSGILAEFVIRMPMIVMEDAAKTVHNIVATQSMFRTSIVLDTLMLLTDTIAAVALYTLFKSYNQTLALATLAFRLVMIAVIAVGLMPLVVLIGAMPGALAPENAILLLKAHDAAYDIALVFFGLHCLMLGWLIFRSAYVPKLLGLLLSFAAVGYLVDSFASFMLPSTEEMILASIASGLIALALLAEVMLSLWLLFKGVRQRALHLVPVPKWGSERE